MSGFKTDNNSGDIYYDDVEYVTRKTKKAKISTAAGTNPGTVDINLSYQNTPGSNDYTVDSKISLVPGEGLSFAQDSGAGTITLTGTPKNNLTATVDPVRTDDASQGYAVGSVWKNTTTAIDGTKENKFFYCNDATNGSANWLNLEKSVVKSSAPGVTNDGGLPTSSNPDRGFSVGSTWLDITDSNSPRLYVCISTAVGSASWKEVGGGSGVGIVTENRDPNINDLNYDIGTIWINTITDKPYIITDVSFSSYANAIVASWRPIGRSDYSPVATNRNPNSGSSGDTGSPYGTVWVNYNTGDVFVYAQQYVWQQLGGGGGGYTPILNASDPTNTNYYDEGTIWINTTNNTAWISTKKGSSSDAIWHRVTRGISVASDPTTSNKEFEGTIWVNNSTNKAWISVDKTAGTWQPIGSGLPAGSDRQIQFNDSSTPSNPKFGASPDLLFIQESGKGGSLRVAQYTGDTGYNYYEAKAVMSTAGRVFSLSQHTPYARYIFTAIDPSSGLPVPQDMDPYRTIHLVDASDGSILLNLPDYGSTEFAIHSSGKVPAGHILKIKRVDFGSSSSTNSVAISAGSGNYIDGTSTTILLLDQREFVTLYLQNDSISNNKNNWIII